MPNIKKSKLQNKVSIMEIHQTKLTNGNSQMFNMTSSLLELKFQLFKIKNKQLNSNANTKVLFFIVHLYLYFNKQKSHDISHGRCRFIYSNTYGSRTEHNRPAINGTTVQDRKIKSNYSNYKINTEY